MILDEVCKDIGLGCQETFVTEAGLIKRIREKIDTHNWKKKVKQYDYDALVEKRAEYNVKKASRSEFNTFYRNNDLCIEESGEPLDEFYQIIANICYVDFKIKEPLQIYSTTGKEMNKAYDLAGTNAYPDKLPMTIIPLKYFKGIHNCIKAKSKLDARYFNDIVDNNEYCEVEAGRHKPSEQIKWIGDYRQ